MYIYIYVFICMYIGVLIYIFVYTSIFLHTYISIHLYICVSTYLYIYLYVYTYICIYVYTYICVYISKYIYFPCIDTQIRWITLSLSVFIVYLPIECWNVVLRRVHYNTLQHTATHCNTLQHTTTPCNTLLYTEDKRIVECLRTETHWRQTDCWMRIIE